MPPTPLRALALAFAATASAASAGEAADAIEDNSFLLEEAYNQEPGVIQHISLFTRDRASGSWVFTFTEEWPAYGQAHQVSATLQWLESYAAGRGATGFGDVLLNYRYQALGLGDDAPVAVAPRASVLFPSGDWKTGLGAGGVGLQANLPISSKLGRRFVAHSNVGGTWIPASRSVAGSGPSFAMNVGQSVIWLAHPNVNLLVEVAYLTTELGAPAGTVRNDVLLVSPGVRGALNFSSGLQIVGGLAVPLGYGPSAGSRGILAYLSFEHPIAKHREE